MKPVTFIVIGLAVGLAFLVCAPAEAQQHRATRLGNPATRFAPPISTVEDLRARFRDEKLRPDIAEILRQWGWKGNPQDLYRAAATNEVAEVSIPVGARMPFMSSRENGQPVCLLDVLWDGKEPVKAYAFVCSSNGRRYRCVTPKPCSNFYLEDLGEEIKPVPALELGCAVPAEVMAGRPIEVVVTVLNSGNGSEPKITLVLPTPEGVTIAGASDGGVTSRDGVAWELADLAPKATKQVRAILAMRKPGLLTLSPTARGETARPVRTACETKILAVPAILIEVADLEDPVEVGKQVTYVITVTNQGEATGTNIRLLCILPDSQEFVSGSGDTPVTAQERTIATEPLPTLAGKAVASWKLVAKALRVDDSRFKLELRSDQFEKPIHVEESTHLY